jgi:hypothetical protein
MNRVQAALTGIGWRLAPLPRDPEAASPRS